MSKPLVFQCPHCGSYKLVVCELREVWYDCDPCFTLRGQTIIPTYTQGDIKCGWADGEYHSVLKFSCDGCHAEWDTAEEMSKAGALNEVHS